MPVSRPAESDQTVKLHKTPHNRKHAVFLNVACTAMIQINISQPRQLITTKFKRLKYFC